MRFLKFILWLVILAILAWVVLMFVLPTKVHVERSVTINAPSATVYEHISKLRKFNDWSVWGKKDSSNKYMYEGTEGQVGSISNWKGDPKIAGEGKMQITALEPNKSVKYHLSFVKPREHEADSYINLADSGASTRVTWGFDMESPRPWNALNIFFNLDKMLGKDFEEGLANLKSAAERDAPLEVTTTTATSASQWNVQEMDFTGSVLASHRETVKWTDISSFYSKYLPLIYGEIVKANDKPGIPTGLFYMWDTVKQQADMAAAISVSGGTKFSNTSITVVDIPASKAVYVNYYGAYDKSADAHNSIDRYIAGKNWKAKVPVMEQYVTDPAMEKDTSKWLTRIIYLVEPK